MVDDGRHHRENLHEHLGFAQLAGLDGEAFRRSNRAQPADQEFAADNNHRHPRRNGARIELHQSNEGGRNQQLVRYRVQQHAHGGDLRALARQVAVDGIGQRCGNEDERGQQFTVTVRRAKTAAGKNPDQHRNAENAGERDVGRKVHKTDWPATAPAAAVTADYPLLVQPKAIAEMRPGSLFVVMDGDFIQHDGRLVLLPVAITHRNRP